MLEVAKNLADLIAARAAPRISETQHEYPNRIRGALDGTRRAEQQSTTGVDNLGHRGRDTDATSSADQGVTPRSDLDGRARPDNRERYEISEDEARELLEQVRDRTADDAATGNQIFRIDTTAGPAVLRRGLGRPIVTMLKKWMPENDAVDYACERGVRTPRILYAGTDPSTGRPFTLMPYVPGETRDWDDPELMNYLPDLLDQVHLLSSRPLPAGTAMDIPTWQRQMIQYADEAYHDLPPVAQARSEQLGLGPLSDYVQPDMSRSGEPAVFAHNDLYWGNLRLDDQGKLWILDWENAGPGDPIYNAQFFLHRIGPAFDDATRTQIADQWLDRVLPPNSSIDTAGALDMYRSMQDWRGVVQCTQTMPERVAADPEGFEGWVDWYHERFARNPSWPDRSKDELRSILGQWVG
ncbi:aminoglycoside phosphotransferase family protein [Nocardia sp. NPDC003963]